MSSSGTPVFSGAPRSSGTQALRRTRRFSWMTSGWFERTELASDGGGTACMTLGCSGDFVAVRLGFPNMSERPWRMTRVIARPSAGFNDYITPTGDASWTAFTTVHGGADSPEIVSRNDGPAAIEVLGRDDTLFLRAARVRWTWTDWAPIRSLPPDPETGMRVLMLRGLIPSNQAITYANGQLRRFTGNRVLTHDHDVMIGGIKFNIDMVSDPDNVGATSTQTWVDNQLAAGTLFPLIQFLTVKPGISGVVTGDSHEQGTSTTEQFASFMFSATTRLGQGYLNSIPFSMVNCAVGGLCSEEFFARFEALVHAVQPSYAVLPGWTYNDKTGETKADQTAMNIFLARLLSTAEGCAAKGILPIFLTPFPRNAEAMTEVQLAPWHGLRKTLLELRDSGVFVIDATSILGRVQNGLFDGTYDPEMSADQMHPNDEGHRVIARALENTIRSCL